jgi:hypothetical protein
MALWKPFRGNRTSLATVEKHDGFVYFCTDDGGLFFDFTDAAGVLQRKQINAKEAEALIGYSIVTALADSDVEIPTSRAVLNVLTNYVKMSDIDAYIFNVDYDNLLAFDTTELVINSASTTSVLGQAILGQMILA